MANITTDQWYGPLLGERSPRARGLSDDDVAALMEAGGRTPAPLAAALDPQPEPMPAPEPEAAPERPMPGASSTMANAAPDPVSRVEQLKSLLQRPTNKDHALAAMFDSLVGGDKYTSDVRARRNMFDQAAMGALAADQSAAEREAEADKTRQMQREQMELTRRGQNLADQRAEQQRILQEKLLGLRQTGQKELQTQRDAAALERAKIGPHHGGAGQPSPEAQAQRDATLADMEASYLAGAASTPGRKAVTIDQAKAFQANPSITAEELGVTPSELETLRRSNATVRGLKEYDGKAYAQLIKGGEARETGTGDAIAKGAEAAKLNPKERLKLKDEVSSVGQDINLAKTAWSKMSDTAKKVFVKYAGAGGDLAQTIKSAVLSPEDQKYAGQLQSLANALIKARSGSAVTGSEWNRVAQEIGWPTGDFSLFNTTAGVDGWLEKSKRAWVNRVKNIKSEYGDIWGGDGGQ